MIRYCFSTFVILVLLSNSGYCQKFEQLISDCERLSTTLNNTPLINIKNLDQAKRQEMELAFSPFRPDSLYSIEVSRSIRDSIHIIGVGTLQVGKGKRITAIAVDAIQPTIDLLNQYYGPYMNMATFGSVDQESSKTFNWDASNYRISFYNNIVSTKNAENYGVILISTL